MAWSCEEMRGTWTLQEIHGLEMARNEKGPRLVGPKKMHGTGGSQEMVRGPVLFRCLAFPLNRHGTKTAWKLFEMTFKR